ncbi:MAG: TIGR02099 family protein [Rhodoferax sp.]|nr:TIGR02099 family protein [Rhodoferax sp.]
MIDRPSAPTALLKTLSALARMALGLMLAGWIIVLVAWAVLAWVIVPRIDEFRPWLESRAGALVGNTVRITAIEIQSGGFAPTLALKGVRVLDAQGREALQLPQVLLSLSPRSITRMGLDQIHIHRPRLAVRRDAAGRLFVGGLDLSRLAEPGADTADWFFSQREFVIQGGAIDWTDELRSASTLSLREVQIVVRNSGRWHELRIDAAPPAEWGAAFSVTARLQQPLLSLNHGRWREWQGQVYLHLPRIDVAAWRPYLDPGLDLRRGHGATRVWLDVAGGELQGGVADVLLDQVDVTLGRGLPALTLPSLRGRLGARRLSQGLDLTAQGLVFETDDGLRWPESRWNFQQLGAEGRLPVRGEFSADRMDLALLARIADRLPLAEPVRVALRDHAPRGQLTAFKASWQGGFGAFQSYAVKGEVSQFGLASRLDAAARPGSLGSPGIEAATLSFDLTQAGGRASLRVEQGAIEFPGLFAEPRIPLDRLSTDIRWQIDARRIAIQLLNLRFANADAQGEAQLQWERESSASARSAGRLPDPGLLDLQASLARADITRVHRYLPQRIPQPVRDYLREAITSGTATGARFRVKGDLRRWPFREPADGQFRVSAEFRNASYAYVPRSLQPVEALPWPALSQLAGEFQIEQDELRLRGLRGRFSSATGLSLVRVDATIPELAHANAVTVQAELRGPLGDALNLVNGSPLGSLTGRALARVQASGSADYRFRLAVPWSRPERSTVQGSVVLPGNDLQWMPEVPRLVRTRGTVQFSESGYNFAGVQARLFGGDARLDGQSVTAAAGQGLPALNLRLTGQATAEGLRQARELGMLSRLAQRASGGTGYSAQLSTRNGEPEWLVTSTLQGLGLELPAPLTKAPDAALPLRFESLIQPQARGREQITLELGRLVAASYLRDLTGGEPRVVRGSLAVGLSPGESAPLPEDGVLANVQVPVLDLDQWSAELMRVSGSSLSALGSSYLPTVMVLRARELTLAGRRFQQVVAGGVREGTLWRANVDSAELGGYLEYRPPGAGAPGRLHARLARLAVAPGGATDVEALLGEQPGNMPALDVQVDDFELRGRHLGRLEVQAVNRIQAATAGGLPLAGREWRLNRLNLTLPEAVLSATGNWALAPDAPRDAGVRRRTALNFRLDIQDAGLLLNRLGMKDTLRRGKGRLEGRIDWLGSPLALDYPSLGGALNLELESGQFLKAEPGVAKLLGVLSLQSLPRRLTLDFRDVFSEGFSFDFIRGDAAIEQGVARTNNLQMKGVNAAVLLEGRADIAAETQDLKVVVVPEINAGTASLIASVINPAVGLGTFLAQWLLRRPLMEAATQEFHVDGSWADPRVARVGRTAGAADALPAGASQ